MVIVVFIVGVSDTGLSEFLDPDNRDRSSESAGRILNNDSDSGGFFSGGEDTGESFLDLSRRIEEGLPNKKDSIASNTDKESDTSTESKSESKHERDTSKNDELLK